MPELHTSCTSCQLYHRSQAQNPNLPITGTPNPLLYFIGNSPDKLEDSNGKIFSNVNSKELQKLFKNIGGEIEKCRFANAVMCLPEKSGIKETELSICGERIRKDINLTKPKVIVALGEEALRVLFPNGHDAIFTVSRTRGGIVPYILDNNEVIAVVPTFNHNYILAKGGERLGYELVQAFIDDIALAWDTAISGSTLLKSWQECGLYDEPEKIVAVKTVAELKECFDNLKKADKVAFDFETTALHPFPTTGKNQPALYSISFAFDNSCYAIPLYNFWSREVYNSIITALGKWFTDTLPQQIKIAHNLKFDLLWGLIHCGEPYLNYTVPTERIKPAGQYHDTQQMAWILDERPGMSKLKVAAWKYLGKSDWSVDVTNILKLNLQDVLKYNALDSFYTLKLFQYFEDEVLKDEQYSVLYNDLMLPSALTFLEVEARGCIINEETRSLMAKKLDEEQEQLVNDIRVEVGNQDLNPASPKQIADYFVNDCGYKLLKKTKTGWSVDKAALEHVAEYYDDKVAKMLIELRGIQKLNGTYVSGLSDKIYADGKIHPGYNTTGTVTGRTSSNDPNIQNFPKRKHKEVRSIVIPPKGYKFVSFDYGQIEARLFGVVTGDPKFIEALWNDWDIHLENSRVLFGDDRAKEMRGPVKNATFAMLYGGGDEKVATTAGAPIEDIKKLRNLVFNKFAKFKEWQDATASFEKRNGYIESLFGKRRRSPMSYNEMLNFTTQSTASDMALSAMNVLKKKYDVALMIHDDLSFYIKPEVLEDALIEIAQVMITVPWTFLHKSKWMKAYVPLAVEAAVGDNWADIKDVLKVSAVDFGFTTVESSIDFANNIIKEYNEL